MLKLAKGGILESNSIGPLDAANPNQKAKKVFHRLSWDLRRRNCIFPCELTRETGLALNGFCKPREQTQWWEQWRVPRLGAPTDISQRSSSIWIFCMSMKP